MRCAILAIAIALALSSAIGDLPLVEAPDAAAAYSFRALISSHTGAVARLRRSSDDAEADYTAAEFAAETAIESWVGASNHAYVTTLYDQSGNARHAAQTTAAYQPLIITYGTIRKERGRPCMIFDGINDHLLIPTVGQGLYRYIVMGMRIRRDAQNGIFFEHGTAISGATLYRDEGTPKALTIASKDAASGYNIAYAAGNELTTFAVVSVALDRTQVGYAAQRKGYVNGTEQAMTVSGGFQTTAEGVAFANTGFYLGARFPSSPALLNIGELLIYTTDQSATRVALDASIAPNNVVAERAGAVIGDSTIGSTQVCDNLSNLIYGNAGNYAFACINIAVAGDTISGQQTKWSALSAGVRSSRTYVVIEVGLNDAAVFSEAASVALARYQTLVNTIAADAPTARIYTATMIPCRARLISLYGETDGETAYQKWLAMNTGMTGAGPNAITGMYATITTHTALMNDGSGNLIAAYDSGDGIHENYAGRQAIADEWSKKLIADGTLLSRGTMFSGAGTITFSGSGSTTIAL